MKHACFPGCSLESTAKEYDLSAWLVMRELGVELEELRNRNCCGASAAEDYMMEGKNQPSRLILNGRIRSCI